jgi:hypothetical protein
VAERAIRTLKEQLLWVRHFATVEELRLALAEFAALYNANWLRERHGHKTPDQIQAEQRGLETDAATVKLAAQPAQSAVSNPCRRAVSLDGPPPSSWRSRVNLAHSASFHSCEKIAPSNPGVKHLELT